MSTQLTWIHRTIVCKYNTGYWRKKAIPSRWCFYLLGASASLKPWNPYELDTRRWVAYSERTKTSIHVICCYWQCLLCYFSSLFTPPYLFGNKINPHIDLIESHRQANTHTHNKDVDEGSDICHWEVEPLKQHNNKL